MKLLKKGMGMFANRDMPDASLLRQRIWMCPGPPGAVSAGLVWAPDFPTRIPGGLHLPFRSFFTK